MIILPPAEYGALWQKARAAHLNAEPFCRMCQAIGYTTPATVVDHVTPHHGDAELFWDEDNWQSLCAPCHDGPKRVQEQSGYLRGCDERGVPVDPAHRWRQGGGVPDGEGVQNLSEPRIPRPSPHIFAHDVKMERGSHMAVSGPEGPSRSAGGVPDGYGT